MLQLGSYGINVHSTLIKPDLIQPLFSWVRWDMGGLGQPGVSNLAQVDGWYEIIRSIDVLYLAQSLDHINLLVKAFGHSSLTRYVELFNEPNLWVAKGKPWPYCVPINPDKYCAQLAIAHELLRGTNLKLVSGGVSTWNDRKWVLRTAVQGLGTFSDSIGWHAYGRDTPDQLWDAIDECRTAFKKPQIITEYALPKNLYLSLAASNKAYDLAIQMKQSRSEGVPICIYDMPFTETWCSLLNPDGTKSDLYLALEKELL